MDKASIPCASTDRSANVGVSADVARYRAVADVAWFPASPPDDPDDADYVYLSCGWATQSISREDVPALVAAGARRVAVLPDREPNAEARARWVLSACRAAGLDARPVRLQGIPPDGGFIDWAAQHSEAEFLRRVGEEWSVAERIDLLETAVLALCRELRQLTQQASFSREVGV